MANSEMEKPSKEKELKQPSSSSAPPPSQELSSSVSAGPDWSGFQVYTDSSVYEPVVLFSCCV